MKSVNELMDIVIAKSVQQFCLKEDFKDYFVSDTGAGLMTQAKYQNIDLPEEEIINEDEKEQQDFYMEQEQQQKGPQGIKSCQFHSGLIIPTSAQNMKKSLLPIQDLLISSSLYNSYGYNSNQKSTVLFLSDRFICYGSGCCIILQDLSQQNKLTIIEGHSSAIVSLSTLSDDEQCLTVASGSRGFRSEIIVWSFDKNDHTLQLRQKIRLGRKCNGIGAMLPLGKESELVAFIEAVQVHKDCAFNIYDLEKGGRQTNIRLCAPAGGKIFDFVVLGDNTTIVAVGDKGVMKLHAPYQEIIVDNSLKSFVSVCKFQQSEYFCGDSQGNLYNSLSKKNTKLHKGWIMLLRSVESEKRKWIMSAGSEDQLFQISSFDVKNGDLQIQKYFRVQLSSYCLSISGDQNYAKVCVACRDGSIFIYDTQKKQQIFRKLYLYSAIEEKRKVPIGFLFLKQMNQLVIGAGNQEVGLINLQGVGEQKRTKGKQLPFLGIGLKKQSKQLVSVNLKYKSLCNDIDGSTILSVLPMKKNCYPIILRNIKKEFDKNITLKSQISLPSSFGEPCIARFKGQLLVIGTSKGQIISYRQADGKFSNSNISKQKHSQAIQGIILMESQKKQEKSIFLKTFASSELFFWELNLSSGKIQKTTKSKSFKDLKWEKTGKYGWELKKIWERMEHYGDIVDATVIQDKFLCLSMHDGRLRVYTYPADIQKFKQFKLFPSGFKVATCQDNLLACQYHCQVLIFKFSIE